MSDFKEQDLVERFKWACEIAHEAGKILLKYFGKEKEITHKDDTNLLTKADGESEELIVNSIRANFRDSIIAEEGSNFTGETGYTWIIDPLDGTTSFAHNFPMFCVSIGLVDKDQKPVLGIVYNPFYKEFFSAQRSKGAYLNDVRISVSQTNTLREALIGTGFPYYRRECLPRLWGRLQNVLNYTHGMRRTGSSALDICFVASGRFDAYYEEGLKPWDVAAANLIASEAGGRLTDFGGSELDIEKGEVLASNGLLHQDMVKLLQASNGAE